MRRILVAPLVFCIALSFVCGCRSTPKEAQVNRGLPPPYMTEAVLRTFSDIFDGTWGGVTIYIQKSAWVPQDLKEAGKNPAKITTIRELIKLHEDAEVAPAIAIVDASQSLEGLIKVTVKYTPVRIKGLSPSTRGGTFEYTYRMIDGKLVMLSRLKPIIPGSR